jgi:ribosome-binding factor A
LSLARVFYTTVGDQTARKAVARALERARPFIRRELAKRLGLRRVPELAFTYDDELEKTRRVEDLLEEIRRERAEREREAHADDNEAAPTDVEDHDGNQRESGDD